MTTVDLSNTEALGSKVVEILADAHKKLLEQTGLSLDTLTLTGKDVAGSGIAVNVYEEQEQFKVEILAKKFFEKPSPPAKPAEAE